MLPYWLGLIWHFSGPASLAEALDWGPIFSRVTDAALVNPMFGCSSPPKAPVIGVLKGCSPMSALGQKQTFAVQNGMSALPPIADICSALARCPLCANSGHMHRSKLHRYSITSSARASTVGGTGEAERLCSLEVEHRLVLGRRLHRQVGGLLALEDAIDIAGRTPELVDLIRPVGDQAAGGDEGAFG